MPSLILHVSNKQWVLWITSGPSLVIEALIETGSNDIA